MGHAGAADRAAVHEGTCTLVCASAGSHCGTFQACLLRARPPTQGSSNPHCCLDPVSLWNPAVMRHGFKLVGSLVCAEAQPIIDLIL